MSFRERGQGPENGAEESKIVVTIEHCSCRALVKSQFERTSSNRNRSVVFGRKVLNPHRPLILLLLLIFASGCATGPHPLVHPEVVERRCGPVSTVQRSVSQSSSRVRVRIERHAGDTDVLAGRFSPQSQSIADSIGAKNLLIQMSILEAEADRNVEAASLQRLQVQQQLSNRILLAFLDVARTAAEADCEEERADQLADGLQEVRDKRIRRQTLIAIVGDAMIGIVAGGLSLALQETASAASAIFGGSVATWFGMSAFFDDTRYEFQHARNLLQEVWIGPKEPALIPLSVWQHLTRPLSDDPAQRSLRESLIMRWRQDGRFGEVGSELEQRRTALFFGEGGTYEIEDLRARAAMLDLLESDINLMSQDLERLMEELLLQDGPLTKRSIDGSP
jgi:hypothetical protein